MNSETTALVAALTEQLETCPGWHKYAAGVKTLRENSGRQQFNYVFALCPRWFKTSACTGAFAAQLDPFGLLPHWRPAQMARLHLLLQLAAFVDAEEFFASVDALFTTADLNEQILLVQSLRFLPGQQRFVARAREAARSNIATVFCAVAHHSDYAQRYFDDAGWNQLVLKAAFLAVPIWSIAGLRERNSAQLAAMLSDYVRERQAAGRSVPWDLFCCLGWQARDAQDLAFLSTQYARGSQQIRDAIVLSLRENSAPEAGKLAITLAGDQAPELSWHEIAAQQN